MIEISIDERTATIHVESGLLDVTYEVKPGTYPSSSGKTMIDGFVFDLRGMDRTKQQGAYIFAGEDFERVVARALRKARHLERVWAKTLPREASAPAQALRIAS